MQSRIKDSEIETLLRDYEMLLIAQGSLYGLKGRFRDVHHLNELVIEFRERLIGKIVLLDNEGDFYENRFKFINGLYLSEVKKSKGIRAKMKEYYS